MFSQYFGESGKVVDKIFTAVELMLDEDQNTLLCIFIDEIESIAGTRKCFSNSQEPQDSLRVIIKAIQIIRTQAMLIPSQAVNALLIALDRLRHRPNFLIFCTSNLIQVVVREDR